LKKEAKKLEKIPEEQRALVTAHDVFGYFGRMHNIERSGWIARSKHRWGIGVQ
jgi:manganese/zinc/iron transport system substrate-binding protein